LSFEPKSSWHTEDKELYKEIFSFERALPKCIPSIQNQTFSCGEIQINIGELFLIDGRK